MTLKNASRRSSRFSRWTLLSSYREPELLVDHCHHHHHHQHELALFLSSFFFPLFHSFHFPADTFATYSFHSNGGGLVKDKIRCSKMAALRPLKCGSCCLRASHYSNFGACSANRSRTITISLSVDKRAATTTTMTATRTRESSSRTTEEEDLHSRSSGRTSISRHPRQTASIGFLIELSGAFSGRTHSHDAVLYCSGKSLNLIFLRLLSGQGTEREKAQSRTPNDVRSVLSRSRGVTMSQKPTQCRFMCSMPSKRSVINQFYCSPATRNPMSTLHKVTQS